MDAAGFHVWERQRKELAVLRSLERLRPEWDEVLDGTEKVLYQNGESAYQAICEEFHRTFGAKSSRRAEWENIGEQLLMFFAYTYFCGAVYDDEIFTKVKMAVVCTLFIHELNVGTYLKNNRQFKLDDQIRICYQFSRELEHSDLNLNRFEELMSEKEIFSFENLLKIC